MTNRAATSPPSSRVSLRIFCALCAPLVLACGGSTSPDPGGGGADAAGGDASSSDGASGGNDGGSTDDGASIADASTFDASATFPCGQLLVCHSRTEVCKIGTGGPANTPPHYDCIAYPSQCVSDRTCACVKSATSAQACNEAAGDFTVDFYYP